MDRIKGEKSATIFDIAKIAGTSPSTVSAVLNGSWQKRRISEKLADKIKKIAQKSSYSRNMQASALRKEKSGIIGMIVPMYDNRYFSSLVQMFEEKARERGLFPIVTSTLRDPELEYNTAVQMLAYRVEYLICTGATDPDRIAELCMTHGVQTINLDLPGAKAPSIISDNRSGAYKLTELFLAELDGKDGTEKSNIIFIGGRSEDHNTKERIKGFRAANRKVGLEVHKKNVLTCGYAAEKAYESLNEYVLKSGQLPDGIFINSTISLEGVMNWFSNNSTAKLDDVSMVCFDWDPFAALLHNRIVMVKQNVPVMIDQLFDTIDAGKYSASTLIQIPPLIV